MKCPFHLWVRTHVDENPDRIRVRELCDCGASRHGCFAKRRDDDGNEAWGPVDEWTFGGVIQGSP